MFKRLQINTKSPIKQKTPNYTERMALKTQRSISPMHAKTPKKSNISYTQQHMIRRNVQPCSYDIITTPEYIFQGRWCRGEKDGEGVMLTRKGMLIIGEWRKNVL